MLKVLAPHLPRLLLQPPLLLAQPPHQPLIPRHHQHIRLEIQIIAPPRVITAPHQTQTRQLLPRHRHPQPLRMIRPPARHPHGAPAPLQQADASGAARAPHALRRLHEAPHVQRVGAGQQAGGAGCAEEAVGLLRGRDDGAGRRGGDQQPREQRVRVEVAGGEGPAAGGEGGRRERAEHAGHGGELGGGVGGEELGELGEGVDGCVGGGGVGGGRAGRLHDGGQEGG